MGYIAMAVSLIMLYAAIATAVLRPGGSSPQQKYNGNIPDEKPTARATRGSILPLMIGRRRIAPIIAWCGDRTTKQKVVASAGAGGGGGKGGGGGGAAPPPVMITQYFESALHLLCVGPAFRLNRIYADGKAIFDGPIDANSHPSGSDIDLGEDGKFEIYWGEHNQPVSSYLGDADRVGVESRWPYICFLIWRPKFLGTSGFHWPAIEYDVEARPAETFLVATPSWISSELVETSKVFDIVGSLDGENGDGYIEVDGRHKKAFKTSGFCKIDGCGDLDDDIYDVEKVKFLNDVKRTRIYLSDDIEGSAAEGTATSVEKVQVSGVNQAHALAQLLFSKYPHGRGLPMRDFDMASFEAFAEQVSATHEGLPGSIIIKDGGSLEDTANAILSDTGFMVALAPEGGYRFKAIREPGNDRIIVPAEAIVAPLPEIEVNHGDRPSESVVFYWEDRKHKFRVVTNKIDADGAASINEFVKTKRMELSTVIDVDTATKISERRSQEEISIGAHVALNANHSVARLFPGQYLEAYGVPYGLRLVEKVTDPETSVVKLDTMSDFYGLPLSDEDPEGDQSDGGGDFIEAEEALLLGIEQVPIAERREGEHYGTAAFIIMHVRANDMIQVADIHISKNGTTYKAAGSSHFFAFGGLLLEEMKADQFGFVEDGPTMTRLGPDIGIVQDLTAEDDAWHTGAQICMIENVGDDDVVRYEAVYLRGIEVIDDNTVRLKGLLRARNNSGYLEHPVGSKVFIFPATSTFTISHRFFKPQRTIHFKVIPRSAGDGLPVSDVDPVDVKVTAEGVTPSPPGMPYVSYVVPFQTNGWNTTRDLDIAWPYRSTETPNSGSGQLDAGEEYETPDVIGKFVLQLFDVDPDANPGASPKQTVDNISSPNYSYTMPGLASALGLGGLGSVDAVWVRVRNRKKAIKGELTRAVKLTKTFVADAGGDI